MITRALLPFATALDESDLSGASIDPLGTQVGAERLADRILPDMTARMWRPRYLTLAAVAAQLAERIAVSRGEELSIESRMAFERLFVSAMVRRDGDEWADAVARLPGQRLARRAWRDGEPLTAKNFLQGASVNGPFGVIARLARATGVIDDDEILQPGGAELIAAWERDRGLRGFLHPENRPDSSGAGLLRRWQEATASASGPRGFSPGAKSSVWDELRTHLRPDDIRTEERRAIRRLLAADPVRRRVLMLIQGKRGECAATFRRFDDHRGRAERSILGDVLLPSVTHDPLDRQLSAAMTAALAFEEGAAIAQSAFDALVWSLGRRSGVAPQLAVVEGVGPRFWPRCARRAAHAMKHLDRAVDRLETHPELARDELKQPIRDVRDLLAALSRAPSDAMEALKRRHLAVQREKAKPPWIDFGERWILARGARIDDEVPPDHAGMLLHPFRIGNAVRFLEDVRGLGA